MQDLATQDLAMPATAQRPAAADRISSRRPRAATPSPRRGRSRNPRDSSGFRSERRRRSRSLYSSGWTIPVRAPAKLSAALPDRHSDRPNNEPDRSGTYRPRRSSSSRSEALQQARKPRRWPPVPGVRDGPIRERRHARSSTYPTNHRRSSAFEWLPCSPRHSVPGFLRRNKAASQSAIVAGRTRPLFGAGKAARQRATGATANVFLPCILSFAEIGAAPSSKAGWLEGACHPGNTLAMPGS